MQRHPHRKNTPPGDFNPVRRLFAAVAWRAAMDLARCRQTLAAYDLAGALWFLKTNRDMLVLEFAARPRVLDEFLSFADQIARCPSCGGKIEWLECYICAGNDLIPCRACQGRGGEFVCSACNHTLEVD